MTKKQKQGNVERECSMLGCEKPAAGELALASDESHGKRLPLCAEHLRDVERENVRYEAQVFAFVAARVPVMDADRLQTQTLVLQNRQKMTGAFLLEKYPVCRAGRSSWIPREELTSDELDVILATITAAGDFLIEQANMMEFELEFLKPFSGKHGTTRDALRKVGEMLKKTNPHLSALQNADAIMELHYRGVDPKYQSHIRQHYVELLRQRQ